MSDDSFLLKQITGFISSADTAAAAKTVDSLRQEKPDASADEIADLLIRRKCMQTGSVGAVTSGAAIIPGIGTVSAITFGVAADIGMTFKLQAELTLEIAQVYGRELTENEKRQIILSITGMSAGVNTGLQKAGQQIATKATAQLAQKSIIKAIPFLGVAASSGTNVVTTYLIGQRAKAYFSKGPEAVKTWTDTVRVVSGVDERKLAGWLGETTESSWQMLSGSTKAATDTVLVTGRSTGKAILVYTEKSKASIAAGSSSMAQAISNGFGAVWNRLTSPFQWSGSTSETDEEPAPLPDSEVLDQVTQSDLENQMVIGLVSASDELSDEAEIDSDESYFQKAWKLFSWSSSTSTTDAGDEETPSEILDEITHPEEPTSMLIVDETPSQSEEGGGLISSTLNFFRFRRDD